MEKKEIVRDNIITKNPPDGGKRLRNEILEEYLMSLLIQYEEPKLILEKVLVILKDYKFKTISYQKIVECLTEYFKEYGKFVSKSFLSYLPKELAAAFDTAFLFPLPKIEDSEKYEKEAEKVASEMRVLFLKNKIKEMALNLKKREKEEDLKKIEDLEKELSTTIARSETVRNFSKSGGLKIILFSGVLLLIHKAKIVSVVGWPVREFRLNLS